MTVQEKVKEAMLDALRAKDNLRLTTLRSLVSGFVNYLVENRQRPTEPLSDEKALEVIRRAAKQRRDSIAQFEKGNRSELAAAEREELAIIEAYLPPTMSEEELIPLVLAKIKELGVIDKTEAGKITGALLRDLKGKADGAVVKAVVDKLLA